MFSKCAFFLAASFRQIMSARGDPAPYDRRQPMRLVSLLLLFASFASAHALTLELQPGTAISDLAAARDAARQAHAKGTKERITVRVADGIYPLAEPVVFEPQDSDVTYEAAPGAKPIV